MCEAQAELPETRWVSVADRESDIYELFAEAEKCTQSRAERFIRANQNRCLADALDLMAELAITCSHSRPRVSNDNPCSESQFKTLKQQPDYPGRFESAEHARHWCADYVAWYNFHHQHSGLAYFTPEQVFTGRFMEIAQIRQQALRGAYEAHPERFINGVPKVALPPTEVWINPVQPDETPESIMVNFPTLPAARKAVV